MDIKNVKWSKLVASLLLAFLPGIIGSVLITTVGSMPWYDTLAQAWFTPPAWLTNVVWALLYIVISVLIGISFYLFWTSQGQSETKKKGYVVFVMQLAFNGIWTPVFFFVHDVALSFVVLLALWAFVLLTMYYFHKIKKVASYVLVPYLAVVLLSGAVFISGNVITPPPNYENIGAYTESDSPGYLGLIDDYTISITNMPRSSISYFQGIKYIGTADFTLKFTLFVSAAQNATQNNYPGGQFAVLLTRNQSTTNHAIALTKYDGIAFIFREYTHPTLGIIYLMQVASDSVSSTVYKEAVFHLNTEYAITIARTNGVVSFKVDGQEVSPSITITDDTDINYFVPLCGRGHSGSTPTITGTVWNFAFS